MSDSESDIDILWRADEIYSIEPANITPLWFNISTDDDWEAYLVFIDEDGYQLNNTAQYWKEGFCKHVGGNIYINKDNKLLHSHNVERDYDFSANGWEWMDHSHIPSSFLD